MKRRSVTVPSRPMPAMSPSSAGSRRRWFAVHLYTNEKMTDNLSIYPRLGYVEVARRHEDGFDRVFFEKRLSGPAL